MQLSQVQAAIEATPKGANIVLEWVRPCKTFKNVVETITKSVRMVGRMGINYDNIEKVQDKRENGELPAENAGLPWGVWAAFPWLIEHKGKYYVRLYNGTSDKVRPEVHFFKDGVEVEKDTLKPYLLASELQSEKGDTFTCKVENMTRIHSEAEWINLIAAQIGQETVLIAQPVEAKTLATL